MPRTLDQIDIGVLRLEADNQRLRNQLVEQGGRLAAVEKQLAAGPTVADSLAKLVVNTSQIAVNSDRMAQVAHGPFGGEK
jgi:hypothetical protein